MTPEAKITKQITDEIKRLKRLGLPIEAVKMKGGPMQTSGQPDLILSVAGRFLAVEIKAEKGQLTPLQGIRLDEWRRSGAVAETVRSLDEFRHCLEFAITTRICTIPRDFYKALGLWGHLNTGTGCQSSAVSADDSTAIS